MENCGKEDLLLISEHPLEKKKKKPLWGMSHVSPHSPEIRDRRKRTKALRLSVRFCVGGPGVGVILEGWSSAPRSCSQEAGCGTPGRRPGPSHPDWSPEGGWWEGTCPSLSHSAPTLYSYSPPSSWNTQRERTIRKTLLVSNERVYWFSTTLFFFTLVENSMTF